MSETEPSGPTFENALNEIERTIAGLERGEPSLTAALAQYENGVALLRQCYQLLERAERSVALLAGVDDRGEAVTTPFDAAATLDRPSSSAADEPGTAPRPARSRQANRRTNRDSGPAGDAGPPF